jgi:hypothetical protein
MRARKGGEAAYLRTVGEGRGKGQFLPLDRWASSSGYEHCRKRKDNETERQREEERSETRLA